MNKPAWTPHVTVATLVEKDGKFLMIEEKINGEVVLNQPAGHWEANESLMQAAVRETLEEAGWDVLITGLVGIYEYQPPGQNFTFLRFAFAAKAVQHHPERVLDEGIERTLWMSLQEIKAVSWMHRSPMVQQCAEDYWMSKRYPLNLINHLSRKDEKTAAPESDSGFTLVRV
jgi:8-oxo-dGTP pyrophosphatase MutT (NUDIX family)